MAKFGLLRVQLALQCSMKPHMIKESFQACGIYPYSLDKIINNCKVTISKTQYSIINRCMPELIQIMELKGEISEADFDRLEISKTTDDDGKSIDLLVLNRRRSVVLTHPKAIERERAYKSKRDNKIVTRNNKKKVAIIKGKSNLRIKLTI
jgi:aromatic ring-opening dioxygenase LigB subunit